MSCFRTERQNLYQFDATPIAGPVKERRGSVEETKRILQEIERINAALGYARKKTDFAFPRVASSNEGYFYPRQQFRPEFLTKPQQNRKVKSQRAINPFNAQNYFYPTPYLQVPSNGKPIKFDANPHFYPLVYSPINFRSYGENVKDNRPKDSDGSIKLGTIVVLPLDREPKAIIGTKKSGKSKETETSLFEEIAQIVPEALGLEVEDEEEEIVKQKIVPKAKLPAIKNDKYLNLALMKHPQELENTEFRRKLTPSQPPPPSLVNRSFNFSSSIEKIQNLTKNFPFSRGDEPQKKSEEISTSTITPEDVEEENEENADQKEDEKSPFGFVFGPKQQLQTFKEGGLIIQRLRVRHGGIAIAGPGGVATAGSGGTAIVGPNGIALTHPR